MDRDRHAVDPPSWEPRGRREPPGRPSHGGLPQGATRGRCEPSDLPGRLAPGRPGWAVHDGWTARPCPGPPSLAASGADPMLALSCVAPGATAWPNPCVGVFGPCRAGPVTLAGAVLRSQHRLTHVGPFSGCSLAPRGYARAARVLRPPRAAALRPAGCAGGPSSWLCPPPVCVPGWTASRTSMCHGSYFCCHGRGLRNAAMATILLCHGTGFGIYFKLSFEFIMSSDPRFQIENLPLLWLPKDKPKL